MAAFPAWITGTTLENLKAAAVGEYCEQTEMYHGFAKVALDEGFGAIAIVWDMVSGLFYYTFRHLSFARSSAYPYR